MCILFVEDEFLITMMVEDALLDAGHQVMTAGHATAAVGLISDFPGHFSCLGTDIHMPGEMNGLDVVEHALRQYPTMPTVVATGNPDAAPQKWCDKHWVQLISKPYSPALLVQEVERLLQAQAVLSANH